MTEKTGGSAKGIQKLLIGFIVITAGLALMQICRMFFRGIVVEFAFCMTLIIGWIFIFLGFRESRYAGSVLKKGCIVSIIGTLTALLYIFDVARLFYLDYKIPKTVTVDVLFLFFASVVLMLFAERLVAEGIGKIAYIQGRIGLSKKSRKGWKYVWTFVMITVFAEQFAEFFAGGIHYAITTTFAVTAIIVQLIVSAQINSVYEYISENN